MCDKRSIYQFVISELITGVQSWVPWKQRLRWNLGSNIFLRDQHSWRERGGSSNGQREKAKAVMEAQEKPWPTQQGALGQVVPGEGPAWSPQKPTWSGKSLCPQKEHDTGTVSPGSRGCPWRSWRPQAVGWPHFPQLGSESFLEGRSGQNISMPTTAGVYSSLSFTETWPRIQLL